MSCARLGMLMSSSFSTARQNACSWFHRGDVVEPVEVGQRLQVRFVFDQLLGSAVEQSDMRINARNDLAVELKHEA